jgi:DNA repair protein RadC
MKIYNASIHYQMVQEGPAQTVNTPEKIVEYMKGAFDDVPMQECFYLVALNRKNRPLCRTRLSMGTVDTAPVGMMEIFRAAVLASASAIVCVHQHPSGDPSPSSADVAITRRIREAGQVMNIPLIDHVIIGQADEDPTGRGFYSFASAGVL